jgi:hypothetical protein
MTAMSLQEKLDKKRQKVLGLEGPPRPKVKRARKCYVCKKAVEFHYRWTLCESCFNFREKAYNEGRCPRCHNKVYYDAERDVNHCKNCQDII